MPATAVLGRKKKKRREMYSTQTVSLPPGTLLTVVHEGQEWGKTEGNEGRRGGEEKAKGGRSGGEGGKVRKVAASKSWIRDWHRKREREEGNDGE